MTRVTWGENDVTASYKMMVVLTFESSKGATNFQPLERFHHPRDRSIIFTYF